MEGRWADQQAPSRSGPFSSCKGSGHAYISKRGGFWTWSAIRRLDRSFYAVKVQIYPRHVRRYVNFRNLEVVAGLQFPFIIIVVA